MLSNRVFRRMWIGLGVVHVGVILAVMGEPWLDMLRDGLWQAVHRDPTRSMAFWSAIFGPAMAVIGLLLPLDRPIPWSAIGVLAAMSALGWVVFPLSGFAVALLVSGAMAVHRRQVA